MNHTKFIVIFVSVLFILMGTFFAFAQEVASPLNDVVPTSTLGGSGNIPGDTQWVWGEVTNLDAQVGTFTLKYLDYENDQEKEIVLMVNENTSYENIKSFDEVKIKDTLSIDYKVAPDGNNLAKNITLERPDALPADAKDSAAGTLQLSAPLQTAAPVVDQPAQPETTAGPIVEATDVSQPVSATTQQAQ